LFEGRAELTRECNPEPSKGFVAESSGLRDWGENLATLDSLDADMNIICVFGQLACFNPLSESYIERKGEEM
jgi:hypothetical protein